MVPLDARSNAAVLAAGVMALGWSSIGSIVVSAQDDSGVTGARSTATTGPHPSSPPWAPELLDVGEPDESSGDSFHRAGNVSCPGRAPSLTLVGTVLSKRVQLQSNPLVFTIAPKRSPPHPALLMV